MTGLKGRVVSGLRWQAAAKLASQLISWGATLVVMRLLAPADYGLMAMTMILVGLTALVAEMGLGAALVRSPEVTVAQQRAVFGLALLVNTGLYLALLALAPLTVALFSEPRLWLLTAAMGLQLPLAALSVVPESMARRELQFKQLSVVEIITQVGTAATTLGCAWAGLGGWALVAGHVAGTAIKSAVLLLHFGTVAPRFALRGQRELAVFGGALTANRVIWHFSSQADIFIAGRLLGQQALGAYAVGVQLAMMPMQKLMAVSNQVAFSAYAKLQHEPDQLRAALLDSIAMMSALSVGLLWGLVGVAPLLVPLVLGAQWVEAIFPLQVVALIVPVRLVAAMISTALIAAGHFNTDLKNTLTAAAILIPAFLVGAHFGGVKGLALAWAFGYPLFAMLLLWRASRRLGIAVSQVLARLAPILVCGTTLLLVPYGWQQAAPGLSPGLSLLVLIVLGGLSYIFCLAIVARGLITSAIEFLGLPRRRTNLKD